MLSISLILSAIALLALSGVPALFASTRSSPANRPAFGAPGAGVQAVLTLLALALGVAGVILAWTGYNPLATWLPTSAAGGQALLADAEARLRLDWFLPWGQFHVAIDPLSAFFLLPAFFLPVLGSLYAIGDRRLAGFSQDSRLLPLFYGLLAAAIALVIIARDGALFLIAWELMALAGYFASLFGRDRERGRRAGWVYLVATHLGTLCLFLMFAIYYRVSGSFTLEAGGPVWAPGLATAVLLLATVGFGCKAGFFPLHVWLPDFYAEAPAHVSALLSGIMSKMGIYGLLRILMLVPVTAAWMGYLFLIIGATSAVWGIAMALGQRDLKRSLAYSSVENLGIIAMALGLATLGRALGRPDFTLIGLSAALFHTWNHGLFKSLLFFAAGAVDRSTGTRDTDQLGGLGKRLPLVMALFMVGAVAIAGLPPFNGFASEWLLYNGLFRTLGSDAAVATHFVALAAVALALVGAIAVACFVKLTAAVFLGEARAPAIAAAARPVRSVSMALAMGFAALACLALGLFPAWLAPVFERVGACWTGVAVTVPGLLRYVPLRWLTLAGAGFLLALLVPVAFIVGRKLVRPPVVAGTWDCGYARPEPRMQYSGTSFGRSIVSLLSFMLRPRLKAPRLKACFPERSSFASTLPDLIHDRLVLPFFQLIGREAPRFRVLQQGRTHLYVLYILIISVVLLVMGRIASK